MDTLSLKDWTIKNKIIERTTAGFWNYVANWEKEEPDYTFDLFHGRIEKSLLRIENKSLQLTHIIDNLDYVYCNLSIFLMDDYIANYKMVFNLDGTIEDDILNLEDFEFIKRISAEINKGIEIAKTSLNKGLDLKLVSDITGFDLDFISELIQSDCRITSISEGRYFSEK